MITNIIAYIAIGTALNLLYDLLISKLETEEHRFTLIERIVTTILWPIFLITFTVGLIKNLLK